jgi:hypothetical protein
MKPTACPRAVFATPPSELPRPRRYERVDLAARTVAGAPILGRTLAQVVAALGL